MTKTQKYTIILNFKLKHTDEYKYISSTAWQE
jgi:hypothetical protein